MKNSPFCGIPQIFAKHFYRQPRKKRFKEMKLKHRINSVQQMAQFCIFMLLQLTTWEHDRRILDKHLALWLSRTFIGGCWWLEKTICKRRRLRMFRVVKMLQKLNHVGMSQKCRSCLPQSSDFHAQIKFTWKEFYWPIVDLTSCAVEKRF